MTDTSKLTANAFTLLILQLNSLIDSGKYANITIADVHQHIKNGDVLQWLATVASNDIDLSIFLKTKTYGDFEELYGNALLQMHLNHAGNENRKWGVSKSGLCLLLAWTNELIQLGQAWTPPHFMFQRPA